MKYDVDEEPLRIRVLDNAELAGVLAGRKEWPQLHLLGEHAHLDDSYYSNRLGKIHRAPFNLASLFRVREPFDPKLLLRIGSLQGLSLLGFDLNKANWGFLSHHRSSLVVLCFEHNDIGPAGAERLAEQLHHFIQLTTLVLWDNSIGLAGAEKLAEQIPHLTQLTTLDLANNFIRPEGAEKLAEQLHHLTQLTTLDLSHNDIGPVGAEKLAEQLHHLTHLRTLRLARNTIGPEGAEKLAEQLHHLKQLTTLDLAYNAIGPERAEKLAEQLHHLTRLTTLDLEYTAIGQEGAAKLAEQLHHLKQLTTLKLSINAIGSEGAEKLAEQLHHLKQLTTLDLSINAIGSEGVEKLAEQLHHLKQLTTLDLSINAIGSEGVEKLAKQLHHLTQLTTLDLSGNAVGSEGTEKLAAQLHHLTQLTTLDLSSNAVGPEGTEKLAAQLHHFTQLTTLDLGNNKIGPVGAERLAAELHHVRQLTALGLGGNEIGPAGAEKVAAQLYRLKQLTTLALGGNKVGPAGAETLAHQLHHLAKLRTLNLAVNGIGDEGIHMLARAHDKGEMQSLRSIFLAGNDLQCIEQTLLDTHDARSIFRAVLEGVTLPHARVMLVGMGGVGKSSLFRRCFLNKLDNPRKHHPTHDIDMIHAGQCDWKPRLGASRPSSEATESSRVIEPTVWDFGGQLVLHGVHEAFLASDDRTVYLVILDAMQVPEYGPGERDGQTGNRLTYWLKTISHFAGGVAPIVIAITKRDNASADSLVDRPIQLSESEPSDIVARIREDGLEVFRRTHGVGVVKIVDPCSARDESFPIKPLRDAIEAALIRLGPFKDEKHGLVNKELPPLKKLLESELWRRTLVPLSEFRNWCRSPDVNAKDRTTQETFLRQLHFLGSLLYFGRTQRETNLSEKELGRLPPGEVRWLVASRTGTLQESVFNPNWLKNAVYSVVRRADSLPWITEDELRNEVGKGTRKFLKADPKTRVAKAKQAGLEFAAVKEFLELSELMWHDPEKRKFLFPRGLKAPLPDSSDWPRSDLLWEYLPEANFHRFIVHLHNRNQVIVVENKEEWQHGRNWVLMSDVPMRNANVVETRAKALVVAVPAEGRVQIRFHPQGDSSRWQAMLEFVQDVFENEIQKKLVIKQPAPLGVQSAERVARPIGDSRTNTDALISEAEQPSIDVLVKELPRAQRRDFLTYWLMVGPDGPCDGNETEEEIYLGMVAILEDSKSSQYRNLREAIIKHFRDTPLKKGKPFLVELRPGEKLEIPNQEAWGRNHNLVVGKFAVDAKALDFLKRIGLGREHGERQKRTKAWKRWDGGNVSGISHEFGISDEE